MENSTYIDLKAKHFLVTGASSGIGRQIAIALSENQANTYLLGRNQERLAETLSHMPAGQHTPVLCDLTSEENLNAALTKISKLDGIVFCAGMNEFIPVKFLSMEKINTIFNTNYFSQIVLLQKILKNKLLNKGASLVFISSIASLLGVPATTMYASSKAAINSTVKVLASELSPQRIRANAICPGIVKTPMLGGVNIDVQAFSDQEKLYPLGLGTPRDVANAVLFHLSDSSRWLTGNIMVLDGGFSLQ